MSLDELHAAEAAAGQELAFIRQRVVGWTLAEKLLVVGVILGALVAVGAWAFWPAKPIPERVEARPQVAQADGSVIAATAPPAARMPPPRHIIPKGYREERREAIVVAPAPAASSVEVDLSIVRGEHDRRVIASSPDGTVLSAVDIPIDPSPLPPPEKPWAAGLSYGSDRAVGVWVERDLGRLRAGLEVERSAVATTARVRLGVRW